MLSCPPPSQKGLTENHIVMIIPDSFVSTLGGDAAFQCFVTEPSTLRLVDIEWMINGLLFDGLPDVTAESGSNTGVGSLTFVNLLQKYNGTMQSKVFKQ